MKIKVVCSECGKEFIVDDQGGGIFVPVACPVCNGVIINITRGTDGNFSTAWTEEA